MTETNNKRKLSIKIEKKPKKLSFSFRFLNKIVLFLIIIGGVGYIMGVNDIVIKGFEVQDTKTRLSQLRQENNTLELRVMSLSSFNNVSEQAEKLGMIKADNIEYLSGEGAVAKK